MIIAKKISLLLGILIYIAIGLGLRIIFLFVNTALCFRIISRWTSIFNTFLRLLLNIRVIIEGSRLCLKETGTFIVSNHLGYLDGIVLGSLFPIIYVSKSQVKQWPLFGWMTIVSGTIFIDRQRKNKSVDYVQETTRMLKRRVNVLLFPEGTSTNGERLLTFQSVHFQSPLNSESPVLPVMITYTKINEEEVGLKNRDKVCWYGQVKFYEHIRRILELNNIEARVVIYPKIDSAIFLKDGSSRKDLSETLHKIISRNYPLFK